MDRGAWWAMVHGVAQNRTQLSDLPCMHMSSPGLTPHTDPVSNQLSSFP